MPEYVQGLAGLALHQQAGLGGAPQVASAAGGAATAILKPSGRRLAGLGPEEHGGPLKPFTFVQMADTQLGMAKTGRDEELALTRLAAEQVNRLRPAFAIVCGDMVDEYPKDETFTDGPVPHTVPADPARRASQEKDFREAMALVDPEIPLLCICGNHELGNRPNAASIQDFVRDWGDDYFTFWCNGCKCLVANSQLWKDDTDTKELRVAMDTWIDKELAVADGAEAPPPLLVFSHIAPFVFDQDEHEGSFNLGPETRAPLLAKMAKARCMGWFCGHYHRNAGGVYRPESGKEFEVVVTGAVGVNFTDKDPAKGGDRLHVSGIGGGGLGEDVSGFRVVDVLAEGRVEHRWRTFAELRAESQAEDEDRGEADGAAKYELEDRQSAGHLQA